MKSYRDIACASCGAVLPMEISNSPTEMKNVWYPGKKCPMCGSQEFYPSITAEPIVEQSAGKRGWRYNPWYGISAVAVAIIAAPLILLAVHLSRRPEPAPSRAVVLVCADCGHIFEKEISRERPPYKCLKCECKSAYPALYCKKDWTIFPWKTEDGGSATFPRCPECGEVLPDSPALIGKMSEVADIQEKHKQYEVWKLLKEEEENAKK